MLTYFAGQPDPNINPNCEKKAEEEHKFRLYLCVKNGKIIFIEIKGKTLFSSQGKIVTKTNILRFPAVPITLETPILVSSGLLNIGSKNLKYSINKKNFYEGNVLQTVEDVINFKHHEGTLYPQERKFVFFYFKPRKISSQNYSAIININDFMKKIQTLDIQLTSNVVEEQKNNYLPQFFQIEDAIENEIQVLSNEERIAYFSKEEIDFKNLDITRPHARSIFIYNNSPHQSLLFKFYNFNNFSDDLLKIEPRSQVLKPKECSFIVFKIIQRHSLCFWEGDINCSISWLEKDESIYQKNNNFEEIVKNNKFENFSLNDTIIENKPDIEATFIRIKKSPQFNIINSSITLVENYFFSYELKFQENLSKDHDCCYDFLQTLFRKVLRSDYFYYTIVAKLEENKIFSLELNGETQMFLENTIPESKNPIVFFDYQPQNYIHSSLNCQYDITENEKKKIANKMCLKKQSISREIFKELIKNKILNVEKEQEIEKTVSIKMNNFVNKYDKILQETFNLLLKKEATGEKFSTHIKENETKVSILQSEGVNLSESITFIQNFAKNKFINIFE